MDQERPRRLRRIARGDGPIVIGEMTEGPTAWSEPFQDVSRER
jgi:hypothetical protein